MDFHSHLAHTEIIGLLGGNYVVRDGVKLLKVQSVFPCRSTSTGIQVSGIRSLMESTRLGLMIFPVWNGSGIWNEGTWGLCRARVWRCWLVPFASYFWTTTKYTGYRESDIISGRVPCAHTYYTKLTTKVYFVRLSFGIRILETSHLLEWLSHLTIQTLSAIIQ